MGKTLYHSSLKGMGPVQVTVTKGPQKSKFQGKPDFVVLEIGGEERLYNAENADCAAFFKGQEGRTFTIIAEGGGKGQEDTASIVYVGEAAPDPDGHDQEPPKPKSRPPAKPPVGKSKPAPKAAPAQDPEDDGRDPEPPAQTPPPRPAPPAETCETRLLRCKQHAVKIGNLYLVAYATARHVSNQVKEQFDADMPSDQFQACVSTVMIQLCRDNLIGVVPGGIVDVRPKQQ